MGITILNYLDENLVTSIRTEALARAERKEAADRMAEVLDSSEFSAILDEAIQKNRAERQSSSTESVSTTQSAPVINCPENMEPMFDEAASTYGVSKQLLLSVAKTESGFNPGAVSRSGAVGIMQLMPETAASLGVSDSYDMKENIMGGAKLLSELLIKYNGDTSLALAAYNAGSNAVDQYGGIPPYSETQNYVKKVLAGLDETITIPTLTASTTSTEAGTQTAETEPETDEETETAEPSRIELLTSLSGTERELVNAQIGELLAAHNVTIETMLDAIAHYTSDLTVTESKGEIPVTIEVTSA